MNEKGFTPQEQNKKYESVYHDTYEKGTEKFKKLYEKLYKSIYERAILLAHERAKDPLLEERPNVLLCGTASSETTRNFVNFVQEKNDNANIQVLDLNLQPLQESKTKIEKDENIDSSKVNFSQGNALEMPFADNSIDLLETDFFLQFFSHEDKQHLINEWARILSENGVITTRDFLSDNSSDNLIYRIVNKMGKKLDERLNINTYKTTGEEIKELFEKAGLQADVIPMKLGNFNPSISKHIIAYKKN
ncbi:methyltransferase domain-containing protein [Candidatus Parcubacteria bacterium]|nr:methyltransferase domain-containing protein [Candidatus Parcubacteria bacterium]